MDFLDNGKSIVTAKDDIIQGCFAAYSSGGKNDKDSCRGTLTKKCGIALDHQCKLSGLYDFINEMPVSEYSLPRICMTDANKCFNNFIDKYFLNNGIIPRGSMLFSYALIGYAESSRTFTQTDSISLESGSAHSGTILNMINGTYSNSYLSSNFNLDKKALLSEVDRTYAILYDFSSFTRYNIVMLLFIFFALL